MAKQVKLNDKTNKKLDKYVSEEGKELKRFIIILFSIIGLVLVVYAATRFLKKEKTNFSNEVTAGVINYDKVSIGTMLNRNVSEYYVFIYDGKDENAVLYSSIINKYMSKTDSKKIYYCDLGNMLNSDYKAKDENTNPKAKTIDALALGKLTMLKVKNGKIDKYLESIDTIKSELGL